MREGSGSLPISIDDVHSARARIAPFLSPTPLREYPELNDAVGGDIRVLVKHENHQPTNAFKIRNGLAAMTVLDDDQRRRGVVSASTGNHGQGVAFAGKRLRVPVTVVVPRGNNPEKNSAIRSYGARLIECGEDYDAAVVESERLMREEGLTLVHSTNNREVVAGAATITLEVLEQAQHLDAMVIAVGGGSQSVGAMTVIQAMRPDVRVYGVQSNGAPAIYESWKAGRPVERIPPRTIAEGIATGIPYEMTFPALKDGLTDFVLVSDDEIIDAMRTMIQRTHNLTEPAGATGFAGVRKLRNVLEGKTVCVILSGANVDAATLRRCLGA
jgi:threonine dehydratase